jgi:hypothetical protein
MTDDAQELYRETMSHIEQARRKARRLLAGGGPLLSGPTRLEVAHHFDALARLLEEGAGRQIEARAAFPGEEDWEPVLPRGVSAGKFARHLLEFVLDTPEGAGVALAALVAAAWLYLHCCM